jgi:transcriptional regulator with XRE-family HTH domain
MKTTKKLLGARIKELRKARGLSQDVVSEKIDIDPKHLSRIEVGRSYPSLDALERIADALGVEAKDLFEFVHERSDKELLGSITKMLQKASTDDLRIILKIVRAIVR